MITKQTNDRLSSILDVAESHIRRGGFNAVSFRDIATAVGIKSSSVHYHFPHKHDLGKAVVERYAINFVEVLGSPINSLETPTMRIERLGAAYSGSLAQDGAICLACVLGAESAGLPEEVNGAVIAFFKQLLQWTEEALTGAQGPAADASYIISAMQGAMVLSIALNDPRKLEEAVTRLVRFIEV
ncbi:MAG: TetR/AcrR family transcriptional regulator [Sneathiella sp.]|nr:TetR/AcrR family transcriptional regulator [Sneathiella sp.]